MRAYVHRLSNVSTHYSSWIFSESEKPLHTLERSLAERITINLQGGGGEVRGSSPEERTGGPCDR